jgi:metallophosphoesterase (TIGR00282 family)
MKVLFLGDVVGEPGRRAVRHLVPRLRRSQGLDFVIANGENAAGGSGLTANTAAELLTCGVDVITTGDHVWDQKEAMNYIGAEPRVLRPLNYPPGTLGRGSGVFQPPNQPPIAVVNLQGRVFMPDLENPFLCLLAELVKLQAATPIVVVDMHAEATSEKNALARMVDGRVSAVIGTHTHVQTADEQVFPGGTAYLTDAGFTGPHESVLGRRIEPVIRRFTTNLPQRFEVASDRILLQGALLEIDNQTGYARSIRRVCEPLPVEE